jgi:hypothetical protein
MDLTEGSETSAKLNLTPGKYPKENIQILQPALLFYEPGFGISRLYHQEPSRLRERPLAGKGETVGEKCPVNFAFK